MRQRLRGRPCNQHCQTTSFKIYRHAFSLDKRQNRAKSVHGQLEKRRPQLSRFFHQNLTCCHPQAVNAASCHNSTRSEHNFSEKTHQPHAISPDAPQERKWKLLWAATEEWGNNLDCRHNYHPWKLPFRHSCASPHFQLQCWSIARKFPRSVSISLHTPMKEPRWNIERDYTRSVPSCISHVTYVMSLVLCYCCYFSFPLVRLCFLRHTTIRSQIQQIQRVCWYLYARSVRTRCTQHHKLQFDSSINFHRTLCCTWHNLITTFVK